MAEKVLMLALSPTMDEGTIVKWNKKVGDSVTMNEVICEVETDKATMEYESINEGILLKLVKLEGQSAKIGEAIAIVGKEDEDISALLKDIDTDEGQKAGAKPASGKDEASSSADVTKSSGNKGDSSEQVPQSTGTKATPTQAQTQSIHAAQGARVKASPLAKKLAKEKGIALASLQGSGPGGRIVMRDVEHPVYNASGTGLGSQQDITIPVKGIRAVIAQRLSESKFSSPHFYLKNTLCTEAMTKLRSQINAGLKEKLSLNAFIIKFAAEAIKQHPEINSSWQGDVITQYASIDIGLAVDLGNGLFTPIVRNCGNKGVKQIDEELKVLIEKIRNKSISAEEYSGATFTISNLGSFGVDEFSAIINPPGAAILAVGRLRQEAVVNKEGQIVVGNVMTITLSCDHRVIDGSLAASFITKLQAIIQNPGLALI